MKITREWLLQLKRDLESAHAGTIGHRDAIKARWEEVCEMIRLPPGKGPGEPGHGKMCTHPPDCDFCSWCGWDVRPK